MTRHLLILALLASAACGTACRAARGTTLMLDDGSTRTGHILAADASVIRMQIDSDGIRGVWDIRASHVRAVVNADQSTPLLRQIALAEPARSTARPTDVTRAAAPQPAEDLLTTASAAAPDSPELLHALAALAASDAEPSRLNELALSRHGTDFAHWLADTRWAVIKTDYANACFDLRGVTDLERPALIDILRGEMLSAVTPVRKFTPEHLPPSAIWSRYDGDRPNPLYSITLANCQQVRDQARYATAVLRAQLTLEPAMPREDARALRADLGDIYPVLDRATRGSRLVELRTLAMARWEHRR